MGFPYGILASSFVFIDILGSFVRKVEKSRSSGVEEPAASRAAGVLQSHVRFLDFSTLQLLNSSTFCPLRFPASRPKSVAILP